MTPLKKVWNLSKELQECKDFKIIFPQPEESARSFLVIAMVAT